MAVTARSKSLHRKEESGNETSMNMKNNEQTADNSHSSLFDIDEESGNGGFEPSTKTKLLINKAVGRESSSSSAEDHIKLIKS